MSADLAKSTNLNKTMHFIHNVCMSNCSLGLSILIQPIRTFKSHVVSYAGFEGCILFIFAMHLVTNSHWPKGTPSHDGAVTDTAEQNILM